MADPKDDKLEFEKKVTDCIVIIWCIVTAVLFLSFTLGYSSLQNIYRAEEFLVFSALFFWTVGKALQFFKYDNSLRDNKAQIFIYTFVMPFIFVCFVYDLYSHWSNKIDEIHIGIKSIAKIQEIQGDFNIEKARRNIIIGKP